MSALVHGKHPPVASVSTSFLPSGSPGETVIAEKEITGTTERRKRCRAFLKTTQGIGESRSEGVGLVREEAGGQCPGNTHRCLEAALPPVAAGAAAFVYRPRGSRGGSDTPWAGASGRAAELAEGGADRSGL